MMFSLSHKNVSKYLEQSGIFSQQDLLNLKLELGKLNTKNFSIVVTLQNGHKFIVKQERPTLSGTFSQEIFNEWQFQKVISELPKLNYLKIFVREMLAYDEDNLIAIYRYLDNYLELHTGILESKKIFPVTIPAWIGSILGQIHRATFNDEDAYIYVTQKGSFWQSTGAAFSLLQGRITPEILSMTSPDYIKFISLYQRFDSLEQATLEAISSWQACCIVHNDLNIANILVHQEWEKVKSFTEAQEQSTVKIIDWERSSWGDPIFDLGNLIANYILIWLSSMVVDPSMEMEESIKSAEITLEDIRPSIVIIIQSYLHNFPEILQHFPNLFKKLLQFIGIAIIIQTQAKIEYHKLLVNSDIYALQVAKSLLCRPEISLVSIFGIQEKELTSIIVNS
ncbi:MAG: phosphotransferase [Nostoc sp.]|uniref:phosphotransferase family protein n=1 Tax=Nostoc sp. TaxID=1180 RepID=UPI002FFC272F